MIRLALAIAVIGGAAMPVPVVAQSLEIVLPDDSQTFWLPAAGRLDLPLEQTAPQLSQSLAPDPVIEATLAPSEGIDVTNPAPETVKGDGTRPTVNVVFSAEPTPDDPIKKTLRAGGTLRLLDTLFDFDSDTIKPEALAALDSIGKALRDDPGLDLRLIGHTDNCGSAEYNRALGQRRAEAVRKALIERYGIAPDRLVAEGRGFDEPIATNATEAGRARNRRVEITMKSS